MIGTFGFFRHGVTFWYHECMATISKRALLANTLGTFGYISCLLQWLFVALLYLPLLANTDWFKDFITPKKVEQTAPVATATSSPLLIGLAIVFTVLMIGLSIYVVLRAPISIARTGKKATTKTATALVPLIVHHPLPAAKKRRLTTRLIRITKFTMVLLPYLLTLLCVFITLSLPTGVIVFIGGILAIGSLVWFTVQYIVARWLGVKPEQLV